MILRTTHTRTAAAWHVVSGAGTVDVSRDLYSVVATMAGYHEFATDYAPTLVIRVVSAKQAAGFGVWFECVAWYTRRTCERKIRLSCELEVTCRRCTYWT